MYSGADAHADNSNTTGSNRLAMAYYLSPVFQDAQLTTSTGIPLVGGKLYTYLASSTTPATVYQDDAGGSSHTNPIILNARGEPPAPIWINGGQSIKFALNDANDVPIRTIDDVTGVGDPTGITNTVSEWTTFSYAPTYVSASSFTVTGNQTADLNVGRRVKIPVSGNTSYGTITASAFGAVTTVTIDTTNSVGLDSSIDALSSFEISILSGDNVSLPAPYSQNIRNNLTIGTAAANLRTVTNITESVTSSTSSRPLITYENTTSDATSAALLFYKSRGGLATSSNDDLLTIDAYGRDSNNATRQAAGLSVQGGTPGATWVPGAVIVETTNGSGTLQENLRVDATGVVRLAGEAAPTNYTSRGDLVLPATCGVRANNTAKAWVTFDGTAGSPTAADSFGVSSITKHATGDYTINFAANIFSNSNYCAVGSAGSTTSTAFLTFRGPVNTSPTVTEFRFRVGDASLNFLDANRICVVFYGD